MIHVLVWIIAFLVFFLVIAVADYLIWKRRYERLEYLALCKCTFQWNNHCFRAEQLRVHHPLMEEGRFVSVKDAYDFARQPTANFEQQIKAAELKNLVRERSKELLEEVMNTEKVEDVEKFIDEKYQAGQWIE